VTLGQALTQALAQGIDRLDASLLLLHVLGRDHDRAWLLAHNDEALAAAAQERYRILCTQRSKGEPLAYLTGEKEFFGLSLQVDSRVLVPRPDTETLVDWALSLSLPERARVIDLGTGSGAIALALKQARPQWQVAGLDLSAGALAVAHANAQRLGLSVNWLAGHWLSGLDGPFDLIVSNPPYIAEGDAHLAALRHEPILALTAGEQGLDALQEVVGQSSTRLAPGGWLLLEHGHEQAQAVRTMLDRAPWTDVQSRTDLAGIERCSGARRAPNLTSGHTAPEENNP
jgi:release factor glutamine methyltransferase